MKKNTKTNTSLGMVLSHPHIDPRRISPMGDMAGMTKNPWKGISHKPWKMGAGPPMEKKKKMEDMGINLLAISTEIDYQSGS